MSLGSPAGLGPFVPAAVTDDGAMAGSATLPDATPHAVRVDADGTMTDLAASNPGQSDGFDINASGVVVGWARHNAVTMRGMVWQPVGGSIEMTPFSTSANAESLARYVNDAGQVAGFAQTALETDDGDPIFHAFLWSAGGGMVDANTALGINARKETDVLGLTNGGQVLVFVPGAVPVLWTPGVGGVPVQPARPDHAGRNPAARSGRRRHGGRLVQHVRPCARIRVDSSGRRTRHPCAGCAVGIGLERQRRR